MENPGQRAYEVSIDPATGLYDRRTMWSRLAEEVARARRYRYPLSLMLVSVDVTEQQVEGHLLRLADMLKRSTRGVDILVRYSKDALAVLLPCTDEDGAFKVAERIQRLAQIERQQDEHGEGIVPISIGVTSSPEGYWGDKIALVEQVEWALRQARREGGKQIVIVTPPQKGPAPDAAEE